MTTTLLFLAGIAAIAAWWLARQGLTSKPWLEQGALGVVPGPGAPSPALVRKLGFGVFLAVVGSLFALLTSAYFMRMGLGDWRAMPLPRLLWLNTAVLLLGSVALDWARVAARRGEELSTRSALILGALANLAFVFGQLMAWQELGASGYLVTENPSTSFFYLITGLHGLHMLGGLAALGVTSARVLGGAPLERVRSSIELSAIYWHFMLLVWLGLLIVFSGWATQFIDMCRQLLT